MDRDDKGKFVPGNQAAVGRSRKHAEQVGNLRRALFEEVTPERLKRIVNSLIVEAEAGQVAAARLVLEYCLGKPRQVGEVITEPEPQGENVITVDSLGADDWVNACNARDITGLA